LLSVLELCRQYGARSMKLAPHGTVTKAEESTCLSRRETEEVDKHDRLTLPKAKVLHPIED